LLSWCREASTPRTVVICMPSRNSEAWVLAAFFPNDQAARAGIECLRDPEARLAQQPKGRRIRKSQQEYIARRVALCDAWPQLSGALVEAQRFQREFISALPRC
jgi:hypothetical protein